MDVGGLDDSWRQQPGTPAYLTDMGADGLKKALARADRSRSHAVRDLQIKGWHSALAAGGSHDQMTVYIRELAADQYGMKFDK